MFLDLYLPAPPPSPPPPLPPLSHTIFVTSLSHNLSHAIFHTPSSTHHLCHIPFLHTIFVTHHLSHTLSHIPSLSHAIFHTLSFSHTIICHPLELDVAGVALGDVHLHFAWQAWHLVTSAFALRGMHGTRGTAHGSGGALGSVWSPGTPRHFCVAGVALGDVDLRFARQVWHLVTSAFVLRGMHGTPAWAGSGGALGPAWSPRTPRHFCVARGRRGTWRHGPSFCVACMALA